MAETAVTTDRPTVAKPVSRRRSAQSATVSSSALAQDLDCSRTFSHDIAERGGRADPSQGHAGDPDHRRRTGRVDARAVG